jgi:hypothetical protein
MPPLSVEVCQKGSDVWTALPILEPGDRPGSISDNPANGTRQVYMFECAKDDSYSRLLRSKGGIDAATPTTRKIIPLAGFEEVKTLRRGESYELEITSPSQKQLKVRFTHSRTMI